MRAVGDESAEFVRPRGLYAMGKERTSLFYRGHEARYRKDKQQLTLLGEAALDYKQARYRADKIVYFMRKDLLWGIGQVSLDDTFAKTGDKLLVTGARMKAKPKAEWALLTGDVVGDVKPKQKFRPPLHFRAQSLEMLGPTSEVRLREDVFFHRGGMQAQAKSGDIFLENANRQLRYFVLNDDVKLREDLAGPPPQVRRAWAERMEGFGQDKVVLSGAPRVEQGKDAVKGYRITLREQADFIEVEDAMSDLSTKKAEGKNK
jgi:lipopolysaccharide export system protein LptA